MAKYSTMKTWLAELLSHYRYTRAIGDGPRKLEPQSNDETNTLTGIRHILIETMHNL